MLAVEEGLFYPDRVSHEGDLITPADDFEHPDVMDDAVGEVTETVLRRGAGSYSCKTRTHRHGPNGPHPAPTLSR